MNILAPELIALIACWFGYFLVHSILASLPVKHWVARRWPERMPLYRLLYNGLSLLLLFPALVLIYRWDEPAIWQWTGGWWWLAQGLAAVALLLFYHSTRYYDISEFIGLRQWRERERRVEDQERFRISPYHRFVRHPWYAFGLIIVWTRDMDAAMLVSAGAITLYFLVGLRLEERKLLSYHGELYRVYRERVPALIPRPWRYLTKAEAETLTSSAAGRIR